MNKTEVKQTMGNSGITHIKVWFHKKKKPDFKCSLAPALTIIQQQTVNFLHTAEFGICSTWEIGLCKLIFILK